MKTMNEKLQGIISNKPSGWLKKAKFRKENRKWLGYSSNIARRAYTAMEDREGMNQKTLAEKLGVKPQYISKLLKGEQNLSLQTIGKLSDALGVELISFPNYKYKPAIENNYVISDTIIFMQLNLSIEPFTDRNGIINSNLLGFRTSDSLTGKVVGLEMRMLVIEKNQFQNSFTYSNS